MKKMFIFTAGNPKAQDNLDISIRQSINKELVFGSFNKKHHNRLDSIYQQSSGFYAWGATPAEKGRFEKNKSTWNKMEPGDYVLCVYNQVYHYVSSVIDKFDNETFAEKVWGRKYDDGRKDNPTWQFMYFLTQPIKLKIPVPSLDNYLSMKYQGFTGIGKERIRKIINDFGSVSNFIKHKFPNSQEDSPDVNPPYLPTKRDFEIAYSMIAILGEEVHENKVLDQIKANARDSGKMLKDNWRNITLRNIVEHWTKD